MYRIAVLAEQDEAGKNYADQIARFGQKKGLFPQIECYLSQEQFFENVPETMPTNAVIALQRSGFFASGVPAAGGLFHSGARRR